MLAVIPELHVLDVDGLMEHYYYPIVGVVGLVIVVFGEKGVGVGVGKFRKCDWVIVLL